MRFETAKQNNRQLSGAVVHLPIREILSDPCAPHRVLGFDEITAAAERIAVEGVAKPLAVRDFGGVYQLISGEITLKAAAMAGFTHVPCVVIGRDITVAEASSAETRRRESARAYFAQLASLTIQEPSAPEDDLAPYPLPKKALPKHKPIIRDVRLLVNTVQRACQTLSDSGIHAALEQSETADELCLVVRVPKIIAPNRAANS